MATTEQTRRGATPRPAQKASPLAGRQPAEGGRWGGPASPHRQRGLALMEMLLLTVPLSLLSIVLASAVAATGTAKNKSMWKASLQAQQATREPCGGVPLYYVPTMSQKQGQFSQGRQQAGEIGLIGLPITLTNSKTEHVTEQTPQFYFENAADTMFPDRTRQAQNSATFLCNEPNNGDSRRGMYEAILFGRALTEAKGLF